MTPSRRVLLAIGLLMSSAGIVSAGSYDQQAYGIDPTNWSIICLKFPYLSGHPMDSEVAEALKREGWLKEGQLFPTAKGVNQKCESLGYIPEHPGLD